MNQQQFDKMIEGLVNPSRIKVAVNKEYDFLLSADNRNNVMGWFKANSDRLEENLRKMDLKWVYIIETCHNNRPFIYMLISPTMSYPIARKMTDRAQRTLPIGRTMIIAEGQFRAIEIDRYNNTPTTLTDLFEQYASTVFEVSKL